MKALFTIAALGFALTAAPLFAHEAAAQEPAAPEPAAQEPAPEAPVAPQEPAQPERPAQPPRPFPDGAKVAYVDQQAIINESAEGKKAIGQLQALADKKEQEIEPRRKALQDAEQKLEETGSVMNDSARVQLQRDVERQRVDFQRASQDAQREVVDFQNELQTTFLEKLYPVIEQVAAEKGLHFVLSLSPDVMYADRGLDITPDVIKALDAGAGTGGSENPGAENP